MVRRVFAIGSAIVFAATAQAGEWRPVCTCGEMQGVGFFFPGGAVPEEETGWQDDLVSDGTTYLMTDGKRYDIVHKDASGRRHSTRFQDRADILALPGNTMLRLSVVRKFEPRLEQYAFQLDERGRGIVVLSRQQEGLASRVTIMKARCVGAN